MTFKWPWQYDFPPFFTVQPTLVTREKQLEDWGRLVIDYAEHNKIYSIDLADAALSPLFHNAKLNRALSTEGIKLVFAHLEDKRHVEWLDNTKTRCHIFWRRPEEWAALIYEWAVSNGLVDTLCTLYDITQGEYTVDELDRIMDKEVVEEPRIESGEQPKVGESFLHEKGDVDKPEAELEEKQPEEEQVQKKEELKSSLDKSDSTESSLSLKNGPSFVRMLDTIEEGDTVIVYVRYGIYYPIVVKRGKALDMKYGQLRHEFVIGKKWGSRISATAGWVYVMRPSCDLWTRSLPKRTQILYTPDVSMITALLDARGGSVICESGTGSGSLSHALAVAIVPDGHLYTHDIDESRTRKLEQEFKDHGLSSLCTAVVQNVCTDGFFVENACDGVFLDVPTPWEAVAGAALALSRPRGGRLVSFSPCIEQVMRTVAEMRKQGFVMINTVEIVPRQLKVVEERRQTLYDYSEWGEYIECKPKKMRYIRNRMRRRGLCPREARAPTEVSSTGDVLDDVPRPRPYTVMRSPVTQPTHTGYLTSATMLPRL